ncbi:MAG: helix-turn-helix domain-containing protein [Chthoniobacteraceae bacterium]
MHVGPQVHALRKERGLSLRALAERANVSASMLCDLEKGQVNPTVGTLFQISSALGVPAHALFPPAQEGQAGPERTSEGTGSAAASPVVRAGERATIPLTGGIQWQRLTPSAEPVEFIEMRYPPGASSGDALHQHPGREYGVVLAGELTLELGFDRHTLQPGDSVAFNSTTPHRLSNRGAEDARMLWVNHNTAAPV